MANINFPSSPALNATYTFNGRTWQYNGTGWQLLTTMSDVTATSLNGGQLAGHRNKIINGNFAINQRAVSGTVSLSAGAYGHDRWKAGASGCTYTFSTSGTDTTITITAGSLQQVIEGVNIEGGSYVLSWTGTAQGRVNSGSYGATGVLATGLTGGSNQTIEFNTGTVGKVQFETGTVATPFERRLYGVEFTMCQRYYQIVECDLYGYNNTGGALAYGITWPVPMRATPTCTFAGGSYNNMSGISVANATSTKGRIAATITTTGSGYFADWGLTLNAEL
jgi:hypothetical protein